MKLVRTLGATALLSIAALLVVGCSGQAAEEPTEANGYYKGEMKPKGAVEPPAGGTAKGAEPN